jgi:hypothetical protein
MNAEFNATIGLIIDDRIMEIPITKFQAPNKSQ